MPDLEKSMDANVISRIEVSKKDLPLSCPMPSMALWNAHPKVYLPIEKSGEATCPYCGMCFTLVEAES